MSELYKAIAGSPITYLAGDISAGQTTIAVADDTALPDAPNICTIGYGEHIETIRYGAKSNGVLQDVTRGIEGTPRAWQSGTEVARFYTAYDHNAIINNVTSHLADNVSQAGGVHGLIVEKGTWTPTLNSSLNVELSIQVGTYVRVGDIVHCFMDIQIGNMGSWSGTKIACMGGLPFTTKNSAPHSIAEYSKINLPQNGVDMFMVLEGSNMYLRSNRGGVDYPASSYSATHFGVGSRIRTSFSYQI